MENSTQETERILDKNTASQRMSRFLKMIKDEKIKYTKNFINNLIYP